MTPTAYVPGTGDLIWIDFDPTRGREQAGRRPALVVSSASFSRNTGLVIVPHHVLYPAFSDECSAAGRTADRRRNPDQPYPQRRHCSSAHSLRRRGGAGGGSTTGPCEAEHLHRDLTGIRSRIHPKWLVLFLNQTSLDAHQHIGFPEIDGASAAEGGAF